MKVFIARARNVFSWCMVGIFIPVVWLTFIWVLLETLRMLKIHP